MVGAAKLLSAHACTALAVCTRAADDELPEASSCFRLGSLKMSRQPWVPLPESSVRHHVQCGSVHAGVSSTASYDLSS